MWGLGIALLIGFTIGYGVREYIAQKQRAAEWRRKQSKGSF